MRTVKIDYNVDDIWPDVHKLYTDILSALGGCCSGDRCCIDLSACRYLGPDAAVLLNAFWANYRRLGVDVRVVLPSDPPALIGFCKFSGLEHYLCDGPRPTAHPSCETVPLSQVYTAHWNIGEPLVQLVRDHLSDLSQDSADYLKLSLSEVIQNIDDHADSPIGGIWCGRFFSGKKSVRIAVTDMGNGIQKTLSRRFDVKNAVEALQMVTRGGHSSLSRENNMGLGVSNLVSWIKNCRGVLSLVSGEAVALITESGADLEIHPLRIGFPGTAVFFTLPVEEADIAHDEPD